MPGDLITIREAAKRLRYHPDYVSSLIRSGKLSGHKVGRNWVTTTGALERYLSKSSDKSSSKPFRHVRVIAKKAKTAVALVIFSLAITAVVLALIESNTGLHGSEGSVVKDLSTMSDEDVSVSAVYKKLP